MGRFYFKGKDFSKDHLEFYIKIDTTMLHAQVQYNLNDTSHFCGAPLESVDFGRNLN